MEREHKPWGEGEDSNIISSKFKKSILNVALTSLVHRLNYIHVYAHTVSLVTTLAQ